MTTTTTVTQHRILVVATPDEALHPLGQELWSGEDKPELAQRWFEIYPAAVPGLELVLEHREVTTTYGDWVNPEEEFDDGFILEGLAFLVDAKAIWWVYVDDTDCWRSIDYFDRTKGDLASRPGTRRFATELVEIFHDGQASSFQGFDHGISLIMTNHGVTA